MISWSPLLITLKLALITTSILFLIAVPVAYWLAYGRSKLTVLFEAIVALPLVLPPSVLGFYLLVGLSSQSMLGAFLATHFDLNIPFTFTGLVIGSIIYSMPFMVQPIQAGFQQLPPVLKEASYVLGKSRWQTLINILLPNIKNSLLTGIVLSFAHTIGEFGVVLMIGGNLNKTRVASIAIYDSVNRLDYSSAHSYSLILLLFSFVILILVYIFNKKGFTSVR
ncbi:molybdate ABC transporter permease subunit [Reichenbachiella carrageenanivorans]|uniref:Molybdenum transport system permease n=1 Tax=Reichenbachiella carrageenanivorans TaxID=2979869 RepID=A0ABY6D3Z0_9BACT|nr:molybdate ABC transporter permease subunit [Reichenbachiella carrageenanivorans]UXX80862.1 molybdate ABC transporter permease subunit [Reichenbachiella carrageenanivorans]